MVGGSGGGDGPARLVAAEFAEAGIPALALAYFGAPGVPQRLTSIPIEYFAGAAAWLGAQQGVNPARLAILGMSRGSEAALLTAAHHPTVVDRVIAIVPSNIVCASFPDGGPAWTVDGEPLPYSTTAGPEAADPDALIPVERINGPVLAIGAGRDEIWPSLAMARAIGERLRAHGHGAGHEILEYPNAGHGLSIPAPIGTVADTDQAAADRCVAAHPPVRPRRVDSYAAVTRPARIASDLAHRRREPFLHAHLRQLFHRLQ